MSFYQALQLDPAALKQNIRNAEQRGQRQKFATAIAVRSALLVLFSIMMISLAAEISGEENSPMAVSLLCILLGIRFVDMGYRIGDSMITLALTFALLLFAPAAAAAVSPVLSILIHASAFFAILYMTCQRPEMGNAGLYTFAYIYLSGNPVSGILLLRRAELTLAGYVLCGAILYCKHRSKNCDVKFSKILSQFSLSDRKIRWLLQLASGVGILLGLGSLFHMRRMMWAAFACGSILGCYAADPSEIRQRFRERMTGTLLGTALFFFCYRMIPAELQFLFGILGGLLVGFCTEYRYKTACNSLGALMVATGAYGLEQSVILRVFHNLMGVLFACLFLLIIHKISGNLENSERNRGKSHLKT